MQDIHRFHATRQRVLFVTTHWGQAPDETSAATRLVAGALARSAEVHVAHLTDEPSPTRKWKDSVFFVHELALVGRRNLQAGILRAALASYDGGRRVPPIAAEVLGRFGGHARGVRELIDELAPGAVVLAGADQPYDLASLDKDRSPGAMPRRVVVMPFLGDVSRLGSVRIAELTEHADAIGTAHPGEQRYFEQLTPGRAFPLDIALNLNRNAASNRLFGVRYFGRYVLLLRSFPSGTSRYERSVTHEVMRSALRPLSVAEVDGERWRISDAENTLELPVSPSRVNLWRLMAHAQATIDLRPPGPFGREALESMLLGTPAVVAEGSAAFEHVRAANGGLWYRDLGELFDVTRAAVDPTLARQLARQGRRYASEAHGRPDAFVERSAGLVLGESRAACGMASSCARG